MHSSKRAETAFEYLQRRLVELQEDTQSLRIEVDRYSFKAKGMILEGAQG